MGDDKELEKDLNRASATNVNKQRTFTPKVKNAQPQDQEDVNQVLEYSQEISRSQIDNSSI